MQLTGAAQTAQFWAVCQRSLFPVMEEEPGPLGEKHKLLASAFAMLELADGQAPRGRRGRPARDRLAIRRPLLAKMCFNLETTRGLLDGLRCDQTLRRLCGWPSQQAIPSESVCSRTFARLAESGCLEKVQERLVGTVYQGWLVGHVIRDASALPAREKPAACRPTSLPRQRRRGRRRKGEPAAPRPRLERQPEMSLARMLAELPKACDRGR